MPKKKILHIIQSLGNGGCENMMLRTLPLLDGFEHKIITLKELGELTPAFVSAGITVETVHCNGFFDISGIRHLQKVVKEENPHIIITYLFHADILGRLFLSRCHSELVEESQPSQHIKTIPIIPFLRTTYNHPKYLIARLLEKATKHLVPRYLANSEAVKDFYVNKIGVPSEKIAIIPNGIDIAYFDSIASDPELKKSLGIKPDDFVIICVANLHINKGHKYLLEAFEEVYKRNKNTQLLIIGDGAEKNNLEQQIKNYQSKDNIHFLGRRTDVPQLLKLSDCFVLPTLFEGMSNAIMEAMAANLPVITTDIPENRELIENGKTGIFVPVKNNLAITQAIERIFGNKNQALRQSISFESKNIIKEKFRLKNISKQFNDFLIQVKN